MSRLRGIVLLAMALSLLVWIVADLADRTPHDLRTFDGHEVARLETAMWRSYYDHQRIQLFGHMTELLRRQYHLTFCQSNLAAWHAARGAVVFQRGRDRSEYMRALPEVQNFYSIIRSHSVTPFDVDTVSRLELEWWIIHRDRARHQPANLEVALADLEAHIYQRPAPLFKTHAKARAEAMILRDAGRDWTTIAGLLDRSWVDLQTVVSR